MIALLLGSLYLRTLKVHIRLDPYPYSIQRYPPKQAHIL